MSTPINIYQVFTRLFVNPNETNAPFGRIEENGCTKFNDISAQILSSLKSFGTTHIWYTGVIRHATCTDYSKNGIPKNNPYIVKGRAGSPYAITDYYDVHPDFATKVKSRMSEFESLVERTHQAGLKCIIDFVPNHVSRDYKSICLPPGNQNLGESDNTNVCFDSNNNFYYLPNYPLELPKELSLPYTDGEEMFQEYPAKVTGNNIFNARPSKNDWYETVKLNYGVDYEHLWQEHFDETPDTWYRMLDILTFWTNKGVDGFRCDMAEMVPVKFWGWVIPQIKRINPNIIFIAEIYNPNVYRHYINKGKFDYLYDKVGMYDILRMIIEGTGSASYITDCWKGYDDIKDKMLRFLENHDEQRIASRLFAGNAESARAAMVIVATLGVGPMMLYFGQEIGEHGMEQEGYSGIDGRTSIFDYWSLKEYNKLVNNGKFDGGLLHESQKELRAFYQDLQQLRLMYPAISSGMFYDLMWQNNKSSIDNNKIYAYLRYNETQKFLILVNFDMTKTHSFRLVLGEHAFETMGLPKHGFLVITDVFEGNFTDTFSITEVLETGLPLSILPNSALVFDLLCT